MLTCRNVASRPISQRAPQHDRRRVAVVDRDHGQLRAVADDDLDVARDRQRATVVEHHGRARVRADLDDVVGVAASADADALDDDRLGELGVRVDDRVGALAGVGHRHRAGAVGRHEHRAERRHRLRVDGLHAGTVGHVVPPSTTRSSSKGSKNWRSAGSGLKRQSSSRLDGASKASGSREVKRSAGEPVG